VPGQNVERNVPSPTRASLGGGVIGNALAADESQQHQALMNGRGGRWPSTSASFTRMASAVALCLVDSSGGTQVLVVRGNYQSYTQKYGVFGHPPACNWLAQNVGGGACLGGRRTFAARNSKTTGQDPIKHGAFGFRFSWSRGHARQNLWSYMRRDVTTHSGGPPGVVLNDCEGLRQEALLPSPCDLMPRRAFLGSQGPCFNGLSLSPRPKSDYVVIRHTTIFVTSSIR
jgi:hypothetical protein